MNDKLIVLLSRQRSGTNALRAVLDSNTDIHCFGEVLSYDHRDLESPYSYISFAKRCHARRYEDPANHLEIFGDFVEMLSELHEKPRSLIDLKYSSCHHVSTHWKFLTEVPIFNWLMENEVPVIRLRRDNYLRVSLSEEVARLRNQWHDLAGSKAPPVNVALPNPNANLKELFRQLRTWKMEDEIVSETFADYPNFIELQYSEMFPELDSSITPITLERISQFLQIENTFETEIWCGKSNRRPLWECVDNWYPISEFLTGTEFENCLLDEPMFQQDVRAVAVKKQIQLMTARDLIEKLSVEAA